MLSEKEAHAVCVQLALLLRDERKRRNLTKYALAARSGVSEAMIGYVESGARVPSIRTALRLAAGLGADLPILLDRSLKLAGGAKQ